MQQRDNPVVVGTEDGLEFCLVRGDAVKELQALLLVVHPLDRTLEHLGLPDLDTFHQLEQYSRRR